MTQNPYATFGSPGGDILVQAERRTSVLAILSLIAGVLCFLPGAGALATIFGGAAIVFISRSNGRLGGLGLAITGIVLGLVFTLFWILAFVGASSAAQFMSGRIVAPADAMIRGIMSNDHAAGRAMFTKKASDAITNAQLDDFARRVSAELGGYKGAPKSIMEIVSGYMQTGQLLQPIQGEQDFIPFPMSFDKGMAIIVLHVDQGAGMGGGSGPAAVTFPVINIAVFSGTAQNVKQTWLVPREEAEKFKQWYSPPSGGAVPSAPGGASPADPPAKPSEAPASSEAPSKPEQSGTPEEPGTP